MRIYNKNNLMINTPKVSIIVPFYGEQSQVVIETLNSLLKCDYDNLKLIFVDNGCKTNIGTEIKNKYKPVKLIKSEKNLGVCGGRNLGIKNLDGDEDFIIFFDSDQVADSQMIKELIKPILKENNIGITTPKIYFHPDFLDSKKEKKFQDDTNLIKGEKVIWSAGTDINLITGQVLFFGGPESQELNIEKEVSVAPGVICCSKEVLQELKGFDEIYESVYEDTDFCFRAKKLGFKTIYTPKAIAWHKIYFDPKGSEKKLLTRLFYIGRNRIIFMKRFGHNFYLFLLFLPVYTIYYFFISLRNFEIKPIIDFLKGSFEGILKNEM